MLVLAYQQKVSRLKKVAEKLKNRYGKNKTISVRVKGRLDPIYCGGERRNPATGESMILSPRKVVTFKCSGKLREKINR